MIGKAKVLKAKKRVETVTVNVGSDDGKVSGYEVVITKQKIVGVKEIYTILDYIESTGSQYIDTGFVPDNNSRIVLDFASTKEGITNNIIGSRLTTTQKAFTFSTRSGYWRVGYATSSPTIGVAEDTSRHIADLNKNVLSMDGTAIYTAAAATFSGYASIYIGAIHAGNTTGYYGYAKFYSCKIYDNGVKVRDYIPAMNSSGVAGLYDAVNDTFTISSGSSDFLAGAKNEEVVATQTSATSTYEIPYGYGYIITASDVSGYNTPQEQTFVASEETRVVDVIYTIAHSGTTNPTNGVYIQDTDGYCHTESEWTGEYTPNGIAVITDNCSFVMALQDAYSSMCQWGSYGTEVSGIVTSMNWYEAVEDYAGESNTTTILNQLGSSSNEEDAPAAYYCRAFTFPNGKVGYMGADGEWEAAMDNKTAIESAMSKCGGTAMSDYYWTSTQYSLYWSWVIHWTYEYSDPYEKYVSHHVRAFAAI